MFIQYLKSSVIFVLVIKWKLIIWNVAVICQEFWKKICSFDVFFHSGEMTSFTRDPKTAILCHLWVVPTVTRPRIGTMVTVTITVTTTIATTPTAVIVQTSTTATVSKATAGAISKNYQKVVACWHLLEHLNLVCKMTSSFSQRNCVMLWQRAAHCCFNLYRFVRIQFLSVCLRIHFLLLFSCHCRIDEWLACQHEFFFFLFTFANFLLFYFCAWKAWSYSFSYICVHFLNTRMLSLLVQLTFCVTLVILFVKSLCLSIISLKQ